MSTNRNGIGELLLRERVISLTQLKTAQDQAQKSGKDLAYTLAKLGYTSENEMTRFLAEQYRVRVVNLDDHAFDPETLKLISRERARSIDSFRSAAAVQQSSSRWRIPAICVPSTT